MAATSSAGPKCTETITGNFSTTILEITPEQVKLQEPLLPQCEQQSTESVDKYRLIKINKSFYSRLFLLFLRFRECSPDDVLGSGFASYASAELNLSAQAQLRRVVGFTSQVFWQVQAKLGRDDLVQLVSGILQVLHARWEHDVV